MTETSAVVFKSTSQLLPKLGKACRTNCGQTMREKTFHPDMPQAMPASISPRGIAR